MIAPFLAPLSWIFAIAGGSCALLATFCRGKSWSKRINTLGYAFMAVSMGLFVLRGFLV